MAMQMGRAFNSRFLVPLSRIVISEGTYNDFNEWVEGEPSYIPIRGVLLSGNKFSQFEEGMAIHNSDGGVRTSDYKALNIQAKYGVCLGDVIGYDGLFFNVLQKSDEKHFGFLSFLLERSDSWKPN